MYHGEFGFGPQAAIIFKMHKTTGVSLGEISLPWVSEIISSGEVQTGIGWGAGGFYSMCSDGKFIYLKQMLPLKTCQIPWQCSYQPQ